MTNTPATKPTDGFFGLVLICLYTCLRKNIAGLIGLQGAHSASPSHRTQS